MEDVNAVPEGDSFQGLCVRKPSHPLVTHSPAQVTWRQESAYDVGLQATGADFVLLF